MGRTKHKTVRVSDLMQKGYSYELVEAVGRNFDSEFKPQLTPKEMLELGVFGGRYMRDCRKEFPRSWFENAKEHPRGEPGHSKELNYFGVDASQSLKVWKQKGWIHPQDPRGWFQWYCRYYMGRRTEDDVRQIKRWKQIRRHVSQVQNNCKPRDEACRPRQRQALLHWAYDARKI
jgi:hypothetical protein